MDVRDPKATMRVKIRRWWQAQAVDSSRVDATVAERLATRKQIVFKNAATTKADKTAEETMEMAVEMPDSMENVMDAESMAIA